MKIWSFILKILTHPLFASRKRKLVSIKVDELYFLGQCKFCGPILVRQEHPDQEKFFCPACGGGNGILFWQTFARTGETVRFAVIYGAKK